MKTFVIRLPFIILDPVGIAAGDGVIEYEGRHMFTVEAKDFDDACEKASLKFDSLGLRNEL